MSDAPAHKHTNRLANESSPYLLQHAHNPVDWFAWGPEAFEKARREDKPIFLSVGYSTCYWCHVMERQCFENEAIAAEMNRLLVNIKVDREERPDVDQLYMTAVQVQTRQGGWPMSVFLLPDLRYFYGGTYFPPTDAYGRPGFVSLIRAIADAYRNRRRDVDDTAERFLEILQQAAEPAGPSQPMKIDEHFLARLIERSASDYDPRYGGFGGAPKFPRETLLELLLTSRRDDQPNRKSQIANRKSVMHTLSAMADGGIHDHLGGGFHRYSTDAHWLVPHFEIMLYDNAMLGWCYAQAFAQTSERRFAKVARDIFDFVLREMTSPEGAFYTAFDAEVDAREGQSYLWTAQEIKSILGPEDARLFNCVYGVDAGPNFADPHHGSGTPDANILFLPRPMEQVAADLKTDTHALDARFSPMRQKLYDVRLKRKQPLLDTKIITAWNALMIRAFAHGAKTLDEPRYLEAATRAAEFLLQKHRRPDGGLYRTSRDGQPKHDGFLDDYAFLAQACLALAATTGDKSWTSRASDLANLMLQMFGDPAGGGFYFTEAGAPDMVVRQKTATDSPLPSGSAVAAMVLMELAQPEPARKTLALYAEQMQQFGEGMSSMVLAAMQYVQRFGPIDVQPRQQEDDRPLSPEQLAAGVVDIKAEWLAPQELLLKLQIADTFHINANSPGESEIQLVPTMVRLANASDEAAIDYPPGKQRAFAFATSPLRVYEGAIEILVRFANPPALPLTLNVTYHACTEDACLPPVTRQVTIRDEMTPPNIA